MRAWAGPQVSDSADIPSWRPWRTSTDSSLSKLFDTVRLDVVRHSLSGEHIPSQTLLAVTQGVISAWMGAAAESCCVLVWRGGGGTMVTWLTISWSKVSLSLSLSPASNTSWPIGCSILYCWRIVLPDPVSWILAVLWHPRIFKTFNWRKSLIVLGIPL